MRNVVRNQDKAWQIARGNGNYPSNVQKWAKEACFTDREAILTEYGRLGANFHSGKAGQFQIMGQITGKREKRNEGRW